METERDTAKTSFSSDIRKGFLKLWPGFLLLVFRLLKEVPKSPANRADSRWQLVFFSLPQVPSENAHLSLLSTFARPGLDRAVTPEALKVVCILEILFPAVSLENTSQASRVVPME